MAAKKVKASRGGAFVIGRLPDGSVNVSHRNSTLNFAAKEDVAGVFQALYAALYGDDTQ